MTEVMKNLGEDAAVAPAIAVERAAFIPRTTDPVILPQPYAQPDDFTAQYPTPLDTTEILALCEEVTLLRAMPTQRTSLSSYTWREMTSLAFTSGSAYVAFLDGECPEEYTHDGANTTVSIKNYGAKKTLSERDIMHSMAVAGANWHGINTIVGPFPSGEGLPGALDQGSFGREYIAGVYQKEVTLASTLVLNGLDSDIVAGDHSGNSLEFTGIENWATNYSCTMHTNDNSASGTFSAISFDRFLSESCAKPTHVLGHPQAIQELASAYYQLGFQGSQLINFNTGNRITPGFNFASQINTGIGTLTLIADSNFTRAAAGGGNFQATLWAMRMTHNGEPLVYMLEQIPFQVRNLVPGCTAISFQCWTATALIIKACCSHSAMTSQFTGNVQSTCTVLG